MTPAQTLPSFPRFDSTAASLNFADTFLCTWNLTQILCQRQPHCRQGAQSNSFVVGATGADFGAGLLSTSGMPHSGMHNTRRPPVTVWDDPADRPGSQRACSHLRCQHRHHSAAPIKPQAAGPAQASLRHTCHRFCHRHRHSHTEKPHCVGELPSEPSSGEQQPDHRYPTLVPRNTQIMYRRS